MERKLSIVISRVKSGLYITNEERKMIDEFVQKETTENGKIVDIFLTILLISVSTIFLL